MLAWVLLMGGEMRVASDDATPQTWRGIAAAVSHPLWGRKQFQHLSKAKC
jgi:hypothetical protein